MNLTHLVWDIPLRQLLSAQRSWGQSCQLHATQLSKPTTEKRKEKKWNNCQPFLLPVSKDKHHVYLYACVTERWEGQERAIEMKQSAPYVKSDWNILAISHCLAYIIWRTYERQSSVAAGTACGECNRCDANSTLTKPMTEFPNASICECYEHACPYS